MGIIEDYNYRSGQILGCEGVIFTMVDTEFNEILNFLPYGDVVKNRMAHLFKTPIENTLI